MSSKSSSIASDIEKISSSSSTPPSMTPLREAKEQQESAAALLEQADSLHIDARKKQEYQTAYALYQKVTSLPSGKENDESIGQAYVRMAQLDESEKLIGRNKQLGAANRKSNLEKAIPYLTPNSLFHRVATKDLEEIEKRLQPKKNNLLKRLFGQK